MVVENVDNYSRKSNFKLAILCIDEELTGLLQKWELRKCARYVLDFARHAGTLFVFTALGCHPFYQ